VLLSREKPSAPYSDPLHAVASQTSDGGEL